jgi:soluble lytic murein transglycosylase
MIVLRFAAAAAGLSALFLAGLGVGNDPALRAPIAREAAPAPLRALARLVAPAPPAPIAEVDAAPIAAIEPAPAPAPTSTPAAEVDAPPIGAVEPAPAPAPSPVAAPAPDATRVARLDASALAAAAALYRKGDAAGGDAIANKIADPIERAAADWAGLRLAADPDDRRLAAFAGAHPDWPGEDWIRAEQEAHLYTEHAAPPLIAAALAGDSPRTPAGKLAAARAAGRGEEAGQIVRALWRDEDLDDWTERAILGEFASALTRADHKYRADRLLYGEKTGQALRAAALAGADEVALARARIAAMNGPLPARLIGAVPAALQGDPGLTFARVQDARRANRALEAAAWLKRAPSDPSALIDPDKWWSEQRMVARELLDIGEYAKAYEICAAAAPASIPARVDAAFHAGWIALRFVDDAPEAARRFAAASAIAETPLSIARSAYWQGRAAEAMGQGEEARRFYERAALHPIAYYGQLAAKRLGRAEIALRAPAIVARGEARQEATRVVEWLYAAGLDDLAASLAEAAAGRWRDEAQIAALAEVVAAHADATTNVEFGKIATERGFAVDAAAFPTFGVPSFAPLPHSADLASVYAVARQESEFAWRVVSGAGAKGLMQILPSTAQETARRVGVAFDLSRLNADPAFNLQLGAAFLGQLMEDEGGSLELALAAYNAGGGRVAQWLAAYGDPRTGKIDPVDWVERIPFDETRDYVERVSENLGVYRVRFAAASSAPPEGARAAD